MSEWPNQGEAGDHLRGWVKWVGYNNCGVEGKDHLNDKGWVASCRKGGLTFGSQGFMVCLSFFFFFGGGRGRDAKQASLGSLALGTTGRHQSSCQSKLAGQSSPSFSPPHIIFWASCDHFLLVQETDFSEKKKKKNYPQHWATGLAPLGYGGPWMVFFLLCLLPL